MTSWGLLYSWFERSFPAEHYHLGNEFDSMRQDGSSVASHFKSGMESKADLLVAADGFRSGIRGLLLPKVQPEYAGYVAWRGVVQESDLSADVLKVFEDNFTFFRMAESHILCYLIPSETGDTRVGQRRLNWVWYWNLTEAELGSVLTDANGVRRPMRFRPGHSILSRKVGSARSRNGYCRLPSMNCLGRRRSRLCRQSWTWPVRSWSSTARS